MEHEHASDAAAAHARANRLGILGMVAAMACFIVNDTMVMYASESLPTAQVLSRAEQLRGLPPQVPAVHESPVVQKRPSSQVPPSFAGCA